MKLRARDILFAEVNYAMPGLLDARKKLIQNRVFALVEELRDSLSRISGEGVELLDDDGRTINIKNYSVKAVVAEEIEAYLDRRAEFVDGPKSKKVELQGIVTQIGSGHLIVTVEGKNSYNVRGGLTYKLAKYRLGDRVRLRVADSTACKVPRGYLID